MIDNKKRQSLTKIAASFVASCISFQANGSNTSTPTPENGSTTKNEWIEAFNHSGRVDNVKVTISTLGIGSAVTTITNQSNETITVTALSSGIVQHNERHFDTNAALGRYGITLKPGRRRILIAQRSNGIMSFA